MESKILLNSNENTRKVEDEEKSRFIRAIIDSLGLPMEDIWDEGPELSIENKIKLKSILSAYGIQIIGSPGEELQIYHHDGKKDVLIGEWRKPQYILKIDHSQKDPRKKLYLEMYLSYYSVFDE